MSMNGRQAIAMRQHGDALLDLGAIADFVQAW
jgi:hypothetical protein